MSEKKIDKTSDRGNKNENKEDTKKGKLIVVSDFMGCQRKNMKKYDLTMLHCKSSFFKVIKKFLKSNENNHVCFLGEFFDRGPYVMDIIININFLKSKFPEQVTIVLGYSDIQKLRFKYELDRDLLQQNIREFPGINKINVKTRYREGKIFGRTTLLQQKFKQGIFRREEKAYILILYERIVDLLTKTHPGKMEYCVLINKNLADLYYLAKEDQNIELQVLLTQLGAFLLVYPYLPRESNRGYITEDEVRFIIEFLLKSIEELINKEREYRDDVYIRNINDTFIKLKRLNSKEKYIYGESPNLQFWRDICKSFYQNAQLIGYNKNYGALFCHNYSILNFYETFRPFVNYIRYSPSFKKSKDDPNKSTNIDYYQKFTKIYNKYTRLKCIDDLKKLDEEILQDEKSFKEQIDLGDLESNTDFIETTNEDNMIDVFGELGGGGDINNIKNDKNIQSNKNTKPVNKMMTFEELEKDFVGDAVGIAKNSSYIQVRYMEQFIKEINRMYKVLLRYEAEIRKEEELNIFLAIQSFFLYIHNNNKEVNVLDRRKMLTLRDFRKVMYHYRINNIFIGGYITGLKFPLVIENQNASNLIFTNISLTKKKNIPVYRKAKFLHSDFEDIRKEVLRIKNYPIACSDLSGDIEITSLNNYGEITNSKTYLGEYYSHTFNDFFTTHAEGKKMNIGYYQEFQLNFELNRVNVNANMFPVFSADKDLDNEERIFMSSNLLYFIMLENIKPDKTKYVFLILDLEKREGPGKSERERIGSYFGYISDWYGFFWNEKRLYQKLLPEIDKEDFVSFMRGSTDERLNMVYDNSYDERYDKIKNYVPKLLFNRLRTRIKDDYFNDDYINKGFNEIEFLKDEKETNSDKLQNNLLEDVKEEFDKLFKDTKKYTLEYDLKKDHSIDLEDLNNIKINNPDGPKKEKSFVISVPISEKEIKYEKDISKAGKYGKIIEFDTKKKSNRFVYKTTNDKKSLQLLKKEDEKKYKYFVSEIAKLLFLSVDNKKTRYREFISYYNGISFDKQPLFYSLNMDSDLYDFITLNNNNTNKKYKKTIDAIFTLDKKNNSSFIGKEILLKIWKSVLKGLIFIHQKNIIHLDLKCKNVLIKINNFNENDEIDKENVSIKITDFDNSQLDYQGMGFNKQNKISEDVEFKHLVYEESELSNKRYSQFTDIYLYGIFLMEFSFLMMGYNIYEEKYIKVFKTILGELLNKNEKKFIKLDLLVKQNNIILNSDFVIFLINCFNTKMISKELHNIHLKEFKKKMFENEFRMFMENTIQEKPLNEYSNEGFNEPIEEPLDEQIEKPIQQKVLE